MKKVLGIALLTIIVGVVLTVVGFFMSDGTNVDLFNRPEYSLTELSYEADEIDDMIMYFGNRAVEIYPSESGLIEIKYYEAENDWVDVTVESTSLELINRTKWYLGINFGFWGIGQTNYFKVLIYIPAGLINYDLDITTSNGAIDLSDLTNLNDVDLNSSNGAIKIENAEVKGALKAITSNGKIIFTEVIALESINVHTSNGEIDLSNITTNDLKAQTSNGPINVDILGNYDDYRIELDTSNGSTYIDGDEKNDSVYNPSIDNVIELDTSNGTIRLNFIQ